MKTILALLLSVLSASAQFLVPSNPPPAVQLGWTASPTPWVTNYYVYYGINSRQYTAKLPVGNFTNFSLPLPTRGPTYFFAVTANGNGLESDFSNEVSYTPTIPPAAPGLKPIIVLTVQAKPTTPPNALWADAGMNWSLSPDAPSQLFRLQIASINASPAARTLPPMPMLIKK